MTLFNQNRKTDFHLQLFRQARTSKKNSGSPSFYHQALQGINNN